MVMPAFPGFIKDHCPGYVRGIIKCIYKDYPVICMQESRPVRMVFEIIVDCKSLKGLLRCFSGIIKAFRAVFPRIDFRFQAACDRIRQCGIKLHCVCSRSRHRHCRAAGYFYPLPISFKPSLCCMYIFIGYFLLLSKS